MIKLKFIFKVCKIEDEEGEFKKLIVDNVMSVDEVKMGTLADKYEKKGRQEGRQEEKMEMVKKMMEENIPLDVITKITGLSARDIKNMAKSPSTSA